MDIEVERKKINIIFLVSIAVPVFFLLLQIYRHFFNPEIRSPFWPESSLFFFIALLLLALSEIFAWRLVLLSGKRNTRSILTSVDSAQKAIALKKWSGLSKASYTVFSTLSCYGLLYFYISGGDFFLSLVFHALALIALPFSKQFLDEFFEEIRPELEKLQ